MAKATLSLPSLKYFAGVLSYGLGMTTDAIYERQRALVRAGLLKPERGRGPGSGVRATPETVALLIIAIAMPGGLSEVETQTKSVASLKSSPSNALIRPPRNLACHLTGKKTFASAVAALLADEKLASQASMITVERQNTDHMARIYYGDEGLSQFGNYPLSSPRREQTSLSLDFGSIASLLKKGAQK